MNATHNHNSARMVRCCRRIWCTFILLAIAISCSLVYALEGGTGAGSGENVAGDPSTTASDTSSTTMYPVMGVYLCGICSTNT